MSGSLRFEDDANGAPAGEAGGGAFELKEAVRRRRRVIILLSVVLCGASIAAGLVYLQPEYTVQALLVLRPSTPYIMDPKADLASISRNYGTFRQTQFLRIKGREVVSEAIQVLWDFAENKERKLAEHAKIVAKRENNPSYEYTEEERDLVDQINFIRDVTPETMRILEAYYRKEGPEAASSGRINLLSALQADKNFTVAPIRGTYAFSIGITVGADCWEKCDRELLTALSRLVNAVVYAYQRQYRTSVFERRRNTLKVLKEEEARLEKELANKRNELAEVARKIEISTGGMTQNRYETMAVEIQRQIAATESRLIRAELDLNAAEASLEQARKRPEELEVVVDEMVDADRQVKVLEEDLRDRKKLKLMLSESLADSDPQVVRVKKQIAALEKQLERDRETARKKALERILTLRAETVRRAKKAVELLKKGREKAIAEKEKNLAEARDLYRRGEFFRIKIQDLEDSIKEIKNNLSMIRNRTSMIEIEKKAQPKLEVISLATVPDYASRDKRHRYIIAGCVLSLMIAFAVGLLLEVRDKRVTTCRDIERRVGAPVLGIVQLVKKRKGRDPSRVCIERSTSSAAEHYRSIASLILHPPGDKAPQTIMVTSPGKGDGKTSLAGNLACALAQMGEPVLLIDGNIYNPDLANHFDITGEPGWTDVIAEKLPIDRAVHRTELENLSIMPVGGHHDDFETNPLSFPAGRKLLDTVSSRFRFVMIDTPPILLTADPLTIAPQIDAIICVVRAGLRNRGEVRRTVERIRKTGSLFLGVVLNGAKPLRGGYYAELHRSYHEYYRQKGADGAEEKEAAS